MNWVQCKSEFSSCRN